jgi:mannitol-1-phosphate/altronate dehydrogenase
MFDIAPLVDHIIGATGYATVESNLDITTYEAVKDSPTKVYVDLAQIVSSSTEAALALDSASELSSELTGLVDIILDADSIQYPTVWFNLYQACQHFQPTNAFDNLRTFTFVSCEFIRNNGRRISKFTYAYTFDRYLP